MPTTTHKDRILRGEDLFTEGDFEGALAAFEEVLEQAPENADALNDAGLAASELGLFVEAAEYYERALEARPAHASAFFNLIDLLVDEGELELAREAFRAYDNPVPDSEEKQKYRKALTGVASAETDLIDELEAPSEHTLKVAFVCGPDRKFIPDIEHGIARRHHVKTFHFDEHIDLEQIQKALDWADVTWFEWCDQILIQASNKLRKTSKVVCRLHGYEVFAGYPSQVEWNFVDRLVFVAQHKQDLFDEQWPNADVKKIMIRNGVDLERFAPISQKANTKNLVLLGNLNYRKGLPMLMQFYSELLKHDDEYHLYLRGQWQDRRYEMAVNTMIDELGLHDNVTVVTAWVNDLNGWLADKSHILSFSLEESFHYAIGEAMAAGLKPVVHAWRESRDIWPEEYIFNDLESFLKIIGDETYSPETYRSLVAENYPSTRQVGTIDAALRDFGIASSTPSPSKPTSSQYWEARYSSGGSSGAGSYGTLAEFKAQVVNDFVKRHDIQSVIDFGCGDGNQLALAEYPEYLGVDVSDTAVKMCADKFSGDNSKRFAVYHPASFDPDALSASSELGLSLDVIYHLVEDDIFDRYMRDLFRVSTRFVIIYSNNEGKTPSHMSPHVRFRKFTEWIEENAPGWKLVDRLDNPYSDQTGSEATSFCNFYVFQKEERPEEARDDTPSGEHTPRTNLVYRNATAVKVQGNAEPVLFATSRFAQPYLEQYASGYELELVHMLNAALSPGSTFVDIGAHLGYFSLLAAQRGAKVFSFEPNPHSYSHFERSVALNDFESCVSLYPFALGTATGDVPFYEKARLDAGASLHQNVERQQVVQGRSLGKIRMKDAAETLGELQLDTTSVVKIDIEGAEYELLPHCTKILQQTRPTLLIEFHPFNVVGSDDPYLNHLDRLSKSIKVAEGLSFYNYTYFLENNAWCCVDNSNRESFFLDHFLKPRHKDNIRSEQTGFLDNYVFSDLLLL